MVEPRALRTDPLMWVKILVSKVLSDTYFLMVN